MNSKRIAKFACLALGLIAINISLLIVLVTAYSDTSVMSELVSWATISGIIGVALIAISLVMSKTKTVLKCNHCDFVGKSQKELHDHLFVCKEFLK